MTYEYSFDDTVIGDFDFERSDYESIHSGLIILRDRLNTWNRQALDHGATNSPYEPEVDDLDRMIGFGEERLLSSDGLHVSVRGISIGSARYLAAAVEIAIEERSKEIEELISDGWPDGAISAVSEVLHRLNSAKTVLGQPPSEVLWQVMTKPDGNDASVARISDAAWDVFISHASEDKKPFVQSLAEALRDAGLRVWYDDFSLKVGDSLRRSIDRGLAGSKFGVVVISNSFLLKEWPQRELDGLVARESDGTKLILPVWHEITADVVRSYSPTLADRKATDTGKGLDTVVEDLMVAMGRREATVTIGGDVSATVMEAQPTKPEIKRGPVQTESLVLDWHRASHERYVTLLEKSRQDWPVPILENHYQFSYRLSKIDRPLTVADLKKCISNAGEATRADVWTGWSMFHQFNTQEIQPYIQPESDEPDSPEIIESNLLGLTKIDTTVPDYWRCAVDGRGTIVRPYREDRRSIELGGEKILPGAFVAPRILAREVYEFLTFVCCLSECFPGASRGEVVCNWWGLENRRIRDLQPGVYWHERRSRTARRATSIRWDKQDLCANRFSATAELINPVLRLFDGLEISSEWIAEIRSSFRTQ